MQLKVVTFNIHHGKDVNNHASLENIYYLLKDIQADIINLQEVDMLRPQTNRQNQASLLAKHLGLRYAYGSVRDYDEGSYGNAILSRYSILSSNNVILKNNRDTRYCLQANIRINNNILSVFNTHLGLSQPVRYQQLKNIIIPSILKLKHPALLAGDFNAPPNRPEINMLTSIFTDTFINNSGIYNDTFPSNQPTARIDYIFVNKGITPVDYYILKTDVSDHLPVVSIIEI